MKEIWKDIKGYEGLYQVSNLGRIKSLPKYKGYGKGFLLSEKVLKYLSLKSGYFRVDLYNKHKVKHHSIHRLVAETFIPNPENKPQVNHIDGDKSNNRVDNLEWCTQSENHKHAFKIGLKSQKGEHNNSSKLTNEEVIEIFRLSHIGKLTRKEIANKFSITVDTVYNIYTKRTWIELLKDVSI